MNAYLLLGLLQSCLHHLLLLFSTSLQLIAIDQHLSPRLGSYIKLMLLELSLKKFWPLLCTVHISLTGKIVPKSYFVAGRNFGQFQHFFKF